MDLRSDAALHWLNNLEAGRQYWAWSTRLGDLLRPQFSGQLHQARALTLYPSYTAPPPGRPTPAAATARPACLPTGRAPCG